MQRYPAFQMTEKIFMGETTVEHLIGGESVLFPRENSSRYDIWKHSIFIIAHIRKAKRPGASQLPE